MALQYTLNGNPVPPAVVNYIVVGDGTSTSITINLEHAPTNFNYGGNPPVALGPATSVSGATATLSGDGRVVTITYGTAPIAGSQNPVQLQLLFAR